MTDSKINPCECGRKHPAIEVERPPIPATFYSVECPDCLRQTGHYTSAERAIEGWNDGEAAIPSYV